MPLTDEQAGEAKSELQTAEQGAPSSDRPSRTPVRAAASVEQAVRYGLFAAAAVSDRHDDR